MKEGNSQGHILSRKKNTLIKFFRGKSESCVKNKKKDLTKIYRIRSEFIWKVKALGKILGCEPVGLNMLGSVLTCLC